ncbi:MAG: acyltransferase family protein [Actinomycetota bacterium]
MTARLGYRPALDGVRAVSVIAVILYHAHVSWIPGGFLGVEVFFVVSGFLITALLLNEHHDSGGVNLRQFWLRRARRLLPALFTMLLVVLLVSSFVHTDSAADFRRDVLPSVFYVSNWWQVYGIDEPYFAATVLPVLRHLWSLAVEEQWYVVWPIVAAWLVRRRVPGWLVCGWAAVVAMVFIAAWIREGDAFRTNWLYLGTLSRSSGLLVGAALAFWWFRRPALLGSRSAVAGVVAVAGLVVLFGTQHVDSVALYRGGLIATTLASALLIAAVLHDSPVARGFAVRPLVEIGRRSYGLYLWHWPLFVFFDARDSVGRLALALAVTVVVNEIVYRFVESPARRGDVVSRLRRVDRRLIAGAAIALVAIVGVSSVKLVSIEARNIAVDTSGDEVAFELPAVTTTAPVVSSSSLAPESSTVAPESPTTTTLPPLPRRIAVVGDSQAYALWVNRPDGIEAFFDLTDGSIQGCGVYVEGVGIANDGAYRRPFDECGTFTKRWLRAAEKNDAEIALVVLGAWEILDLKIDGMTLQVGSTTADQIFERQLRFAIDTLRADGLVVALLEVPCFRPVDSWDDAILDRADDSHAAHLNDLMRDVVASYESGVHFVEGPDQWCDASPEAIDLDYRYDGVHVYRRGAKLVFETIAEQLLRIPVPADGLGN